MSAAAAALSLAMEFGFDEPVWPTPVLVAIQLIAVVLYAASRVHAVHTASDRRHALRLAWLDALLLSATGAGVLAFVELSAQPVLKASAVYVAVIQGLLAAGLMVETVRWNLAVAQQRLHPARLIAWTFILLIAAGGCLLSLPAATTHEVRAAADFSIPRHILNGVFTSTSAVCVTGLTVYDTGGDFTLFGQFVILALIQLGGLGIMIFGSAFGLLLGRQLSVQQSLVLQDATSYETLGRMRTMIMFIVAFTFAAEAVGAVLLYPMWSGDLTTGERLFRSVFHAVSAFCNAGFALQDTSLILYGNAWQVYACIAPLIILGGLGFPVLYDLSRGCTAAVRRWRSRRGGLSPAGLHAFAGGLRALHKAAGGTAAPHPVSGKKPVSHAVARTRRLSPAPSGRASGSHAPSEDLPAPEPVTGGMPVSPLAARRHRFTLHSRLVLAGTVVLIVVPAITFFILESVPALSPVARVVSPGEAHASPAATMHDASWVARALDALFLSVTCRTAGFNTVAMDTASLSPSTHALACILMFIGGAPASTAGGVKVVAVVVLLLSVWGTLRGRGHVEAFGRTIPDVLVRRSAVLLTVMVMLVGAMTLLLTLTERAPLLECVFEVVSACGTVGLSTGLTAKLSMAGRVVVMVGMIAGRLGPLTLLIALTGRTAATRYTYPDEHVTIC
ncbi:MAG: TrkH family potassium uptake protein [Phycisphaerae bacterium]